MFLFSTDIDGTIYDGDQTAERFAAFWEGLQESPEKPFLCYNTGRSLEDTRKLIDTTPLPTPDYITCGVGTVIFDNARQTILDGWSEELEAGWDFKTARETIQQAAHGVSMQPDECQNPYKCSWFWEEKTAGEIRSLEEALSASGIDAQVVYSSNRDLDILPAKANKGNALTWLLHRLDYRKDRVAVAGDSGNDVSLFLVPGVYGIVVSNAEKALSDAVANCNTHLAKRPCADGVIEGLSQWIDSGFLISPN